MLKLAGAVCVMLASVGGFAQLRMALQRRAMELLSWLGAVRLLQSEISWGLTPLPGVCGALAGQLGGCVGEFWRKLADLLDSPRSAALPELWQSLLGQEAAGWHLLAEDLRILAELGAGLGSSGLGEQQRLLALAEQRLQRASDEAAAAYARLSRLLGGLGWCGGLLLVCLWL